MTHHKPRSLKDHPSGSELGIAFERGEISAHDLDHDDFDCAQCDRPLALGKRPDLVVSLAALLFLSGCAELMVLSSATAIVASLPSTKTQEQANTRTFAYPVADVFNVLTQEVEKNGRTIVERDAASSTLRISYPFSLLKNNWGGTIGITCTAIESGTAVTINGDGRDVISHIREIGDEILGDVERALRQQPRVL